MIATYARLMTIEALRSLARNKVRSGLAMLGIVVGVATVICVVSIGRAGKERAMTSLDDLGDNLVWVEAGSRTTGGVRTGSHGMTTLTPQDADAIRLEAPLIARVSENVDGRVQLVYGTSNWGTGFRGVSPDYFDIRRWRLARGELFDDDDLRRATTKVVIGETVQRKLFGDVDPIGEQIRIRSSSFTVIGVLAPKGQSAMGQDQDDTVIMPWTTARRRLLGKDVTWLDDIVCSALSTDTIPAATAQVSALLRDRHHIAPGTEDDFNIRHPEELLQAKIKAANTIETLLFVIASVALLVGGIGIMNVMLAALAQRTHEIGVRAAVGARPSAIQIQFLGEALMLATLGGTIGVGVGATASPSIAASLGWPISMSIETDVLAVVFSIVIGVFFGYYPATRAARLDPIDALRAT